MINKCELCGEPMPSGEDVFKYHGYSGPCPKPPLPKESEIDWKARAESAEAQVALLSASQRTPHTIEVCELCGYKQDEEFDAGHFITWAECLASNCPVRTLKSTEK